MENLPAVRKEALFHVLGEGNSSITVNRDICQGYYLAANKCVLKAYGCRHRSVHPSLSVKR